MEKGIRIVVGLLGVLFAVQALGFVVDPAAAVEGLGMPLLDGLARSSQVGDMTAFFSCLSGFILVGAIRREKTWLLAGAALLLATAVFRSLAWAMHGADLATQFIVIEIITGGILVFGATKIEGGAEA